MSERLRVLCVDDEPEVVELTETYLRRELSDATVITAAGGEEALEVLAAEDVDCVVSDYDMPGTNGIELLQAVREDHPDLPFILFTGKGSEEVASEAISAGVTDYLQKAGPEQFALLANRIEHAVDQWRAEAELERTRDKLEQLHAMALELREAEDAEAVHRHAVAAASRVLEFDMCGIYAAEGGHFVPKALVNFPADSARFSTDEGLMGKTYQRGESYRVDDVADEDAARPAREEIRSAISVPVGDRAVFQAVSTELAFFDDRDLELAELLAAHAADALDRIGYRQSLEAGDG